MSGLNDTSISQSDTDASDILSSLTHWLFILQQLAVLTDIISNTPGFGHMH
jgi:hypothetical protein